MRPTTEMMLTKPGHSPVPSLIIGFWPTEMMLTKPGHSPVPSLIIGFWPNSIFPQCTMIMLDTCQRDFYDRVYRRCRGR